MLVEGLQGHLLLEHPHSTVEPLVASLAGAGRALTEHELCAPKSPAPIVAGLC